MEPFAWCFLRCLPARSISVSCRSRSLVRNDSLQLLLDMNLEAVNVSASTAVIFTPQLLD